LSRQCAGALYQKRLVNTERYITEELKTEASAFCAISTGLEGELYRIN
jgi:hypothetical protein